MTDKTKRIILIAAGVLLCHIYKLINVLLL